MNGHYLMMRLIGQPVLYQPISAKQKFCDFRYGQNLVTDVTPSDAERGVQRRRMGMQHLVRVCYRGVLSGRAAKKRDHEIRESRTK